MFKAVVLFITLITCSLAMEKSDRDEKSNPVSIAGVWTELRLQGVTRRMHITKETEYNDLVLFVDHEI